jgi:hypothetical protein
MLGNQTARKLARVNEGEPNITGEHGLDGDALVFMRFSRTIMPSTGHADRMTGSSNQHAAWRPARDVTEPSIPLSRTRLNRIDQDAGG